MSWFDHEVCSGFIKPEYSDRYDITRTCPSIGKNLDLLQDIAVHKITIRVPEEKHATNLIDSLWNAGIDAVFEFPNHLNEMNRARVIAYIERRPLEFYGDSMLEIFVELNADQLPPTEDGYGEYC